MKKQLHKIKIAAENFSQRLVCFYFLSFTQFSFVDNDGVSECPCWKFEFRNTMHTFPCYRIRIFLYITSLSDNANIVIEGVTKVFDD